MQQLHGLAHTYAKVFHFLIKLCQTRNLLTRTIDVQCKEYCCGVCVVNSDWVLCNCTTIIRGHVYVNSCEHRPCSDIADTRTMSILIHIIQKDQLNLWCNYRIATQLIEASYVATQLIVCCDITNLLFLCSIPPCVLVHIVYMHSTPQRCSTVFLVFEM